MSDYEDNDDVFDEYGIEEFNPDFGAEPYDIKWTVGTLSDDFPMAPIFEKGQVLPTDIKYPERYWKERKMLIGDIDFLSRLSKNHFHIVVYAGSSSGKHIKILSDMFQNIEFHLYDTKEFSKNIIGQPRIKINPYYINNNIVEDRGNFTDKVAEYYNKLSSKAVIVFISRIKSNLSTDELLKINQSQQENWIKIMKPVISMVRFKIPYEKNDVYPYLNGELRFNCWDMGNSDETRLIVIPPFSLKNRKYSTYRENMSWYNLVLRNENLSNTMLESFGIPLRMTLRNFWNRYLNDDKNMELGFDFVFELKIITFYLQNYASNINYEEYTRLLDYINSILMSENTTFSSYFAEEEEEVDISKFREMDILSMPEFEPEEKKDDFAVPFRQLEQIGAPRAFGVEEDLSTMLDNKFGRFDRLTRTNEQIYNILAVKAKERLGLSYDVLNDTLRIMNNIKKENRGLRYKNPVAIMLASMCLQNKKIDKNKLNKIYEQYGKLENMTKADILRYCFFLVDIL